MQTDSNNWLRLTRNTTVKIINTHLKNNSAYFYLTLYNICYIIYVI